MIKAVLRAIRYYSIAFFTRFAQVVIGASFGRSITLSKNGEGRYSIPLLSLPRYRARPEFCATLVFYKDKRLV